MDIYLDYEQSSHKGADWSNINKTAAPSSGQINKHQFVEKEMGVNFRLNNYLQEVDLLQVINNSKNINKPRNILSTVQLL